MKVKVFSVFLIFLISLMFASCKQDGIEEDAIPQKEENEPSEETKETEKPEETLKKKVSVSFINDSLYTVNVFVNAYRTENGSVEITVPPKTTKNAYLDESSEKTGDVFYFEYLIPIGETDFLYFSYSSSKTYLVFAEKENQIKIDSLSSCPTKSSYLLIENQSSSSAYLVNGNSVLTPYGKDSYFIEDGKNAVFLLGQNDEEIYYKNTNLLKITSGTKSISLPKINFELGNVYSISITDSDAILKSVAPFDVDTKNKIWSRESFGSNLSPSQFVSHVLRTRFDSSNGSVICGVLKSIASSFGQTAKVIFFDWYGKIVNQAEIEISDVNGNLAKSYLFYDFLESTSGDFIILIKTFFENSSAIYLTCWNSSLKNCKWLYKINQDDADYLFSVNTKGKIAEIDENTFALCGSRNNALFLEKIYYDESENSVKANYFIEDSETDENKENIFTSMIYDGSSFILTGYKNFDGIYSSESEHSGIVYKIDSNLKNGKEIYSKEKCLFYGIEADFSENFYICGEGADNSNSLHGFFISSQMILNKEEPLLFEGSKAHSWFTQICAEENKITFSGQTSSSLNGKDSNALVVAINKNGGKIWQNEFTDFDAVYSCMENGIGSFLIELFNATTKQSKIISTDFLGNDTGCKLENFGL